jgi:hypothetical protein
VLSQRNYFPTLNSVNRDFERGPVLSNLLFHRGPAARFPVRREFEIRPFRKNNFPESGRDPMKIHPRDESS